MNQTRPSDLTDRTRQIFNHIVQNYLETGLPVASSKIAGFDQIDLSPASVRAIMAELERAELLYAPHVSAGRLPTQAGLRLFVDGLMQLGGQLPVEEQQSLDQLALRQGQNVTQLLDQATQSLSGLSRCASLVLAPTQDLLVSHLEFVALSSDRLLVILVFSNGQVENRIITLSEPLNPAHLTAASNYLNHHYQGKSVAEIQALLGADLAHHQAELDVLTHDLIQKGMAVWSDGRGDKDASLIFQGQSHLLQDIKADEQLDQVARLFDLVEMRTQMQSLMAGVAEADGLKIYIGSDHPLFSGTGCAMVLSPYRNAQNQIIGAIGVIGPRHMNYARIIPLVDYTSQTLEKLVGQ